MAVVGADAGRFLATVLECVEAERRNRRRIRMIEDAEDPTLLPQAIVAVAGKCETIDRGHAALMCQRHLRVWAASITRIRRVTISTRNADTRCRSRHTPVI